MPPVHSYAPRGVQPHMSPFSSVHLYVLRDFCMLWRVLRAPYMLDTSLTPPLYGGTSPSVYTPLICWLPCASVCFRDICMSYGDFPICWGFGGVPHLLGVLGASADEMSLCSFLYIFVVHYVSCFYYSSDYYSSSYSGIFWPVISFISDCGSFPDRVSAWSGSTTTLDAERLWRCHWLCLCATAATSIFDASSGLCQLCYGFATGRFLFQS